MHFQGQREKICKGPAGTGCHCADPPQSQSTQPAAAAAARLPGKVLYGSQKGTAALFANQLVRQAATFGVELQAVDLETYEVEQLWKEHLVLLVLSLLTGLHICKVCELFSSCCPKGHCSTNALPLCQGIAGAISLLLPYVFVHV